VVVGSYALIVSHVHMRFLQLTRIESIGVCNERIAITKSRGPRRLNGSCHSFRQSDGQARSLGAPRVYAIPYFKPVDGVLDVMHSVACVVRM